VHAHSITTFLQRSAMRALRTSRYLAVRSRISQGKGTLTLVILAHRRVPTQVPISQLGEAATARDIPHCGRHVGVQGSQVCR
jgi:hypothetical protein